MSVVQWLLLMLGIGAVIGVYLYTRRLRNDDPWQDMEDGVDEARLGHDPEADSWIVGVRTVSGGQTQEGAEDADGMQDFDIPARGPAQKAAAPKPTPTAAPKPGPTPKQPAKSAPEPADKQHIFTLHVRAANGRFAGPEIHEALETEKLKFGFHDIYHRLTEVDGVPETVFSVANMVKPGFLDPKEAEQLETPGLTLFLVLPGPLPGTEAFRDMRQTAQALAQQLGGDVLDGERNPLTVQSSQFLHDEIAELERLQRVKSA